MGRGGSVGKTVRTKAGARQRPRVPGLWTALGTGWGHAGVLLWTSVTHSCGRALWADRNAEVTCGDVVHRLCTMTNSVAPAGYGRRRERLAEPRRTSPDPPVEVVRSTRRRRTVSAHRAGDRIVVSVPARISRAEEARWVALMVARVLASERKLRPSDEDLLVRAAGCRERYLAAARCR